MVANSTEAGSLPQTPTSTNTVGAANLIYAIVGLIVAGLAAIVALAIFGGAGSAANIGIVLAFITPTVVGLLALMKVDAVHVSINSRMTELLGSVRKEGETANVVAREEGRIGGMTEAAAMIQATPGLVPIGDGPILAQVKTNADAIALIQSTNKESDTVPAVNVVVDAMAEGIQAVTDKIKTDTTEIKADTNKLIADSHPERTAELAEAPALKKKRVRKSRAKPKPPVEPTEEDPTKVAGVIRASIVKSIEDRAREEKS